MTTKSGEVWIYTRQPRESQGITGRHPTTARLTRSAKFGFGQLILFLVHLDRMEAADHRPDRQTRELENT